MSAPKRRTFARNEKGRDFVLGDLHGCLGHFNALLEDIDFDEKIDRMFSVGDLIDRGPKSLECLKLIEKPWFHCVQGNHEDMMIHELVHKEYMWWDRNGGEWSKDALKNHNKELMHLLQATMNLPYAIVIETEACGRVGVCHAESPDTWEEGEYVDVQSMLWERNKYRWAAHMGKVPKGVDMTVHGHTPIGLTPKHHGKMNAWWIDTGCFATGVLTALQIDGNGVEKKPKVHKVSIPNKAPGWAESEEEKVSIDIDDPLYNALII